MSVSGVGGAGGAPEIQDVESQTTTAAPETAAASGQVDLASQRIYGASYVSGQKSPISGQYVTVDSRGKPVGGESTIVKGEPFPPAGRPGLTFRLVDPTRGLTPSGGVGGDVVGTPGTKAERSGQYQLVDKNGKAQDRAATVVKGEPFPPTPTSGQKWKLMDATGTKRPGEKCEISGQYALLGANGGFAGEVTVAKGEPFPPTPKPGQAYALIDATHHLGGEQARGDFRPGQIARVSGQYEVISKDGRKTGREVTVTRGERFPPTSSPGETFKLRDPTAPAPARPTAPPAPTAPTTPTGPATGLSAAQLTDALEYAAKLPDGETVMWMSEGDYPVEPMMSKNPQNLPITGETAMKLFEPLLNDLFEGQDAEFPKDFMTETSSEAETKKILDEFDEVSDPSDPDQVADGAAFGRIRDLLRANLTDIRFVRVGAKDEDDPTTMGIDDGLYVHLIVGKTRDGQVAGVYYGSVET